jgi:chemotaxis protein histidine kinase CheA
MPAIRRFSTPRALHKEDIHTEGTVRRKGRNKTLGAGAAAVVVFLLSGCGSPQASLTSAAGTVSATATATPTAKPIANTACSTANAQQVSAGVNYVCTKDESGRLVWLEAAQSKLVTDKIAAAAAAKAAADKAAADKAAADKAAADKAAADKAAADKAAADAAAAQQAAAEKAARDAAAAKAAADAAKAATPPAPVAQPVPGTNPGCDPNYSGCVPIASDVDCAGGSGNGPAYVRGPVQVIGRDIYGLDADHDGVGCE